MVPSGASIGIYESETLELSDGGSNYLGKDVSKAVDNFMVYELMEPKTSGVNAIKIKSLEPMVSLMRANLGPFVNGIRLYKAKIEEQQVNID